MHQIDNSCILLVKYFVNYLLTYILYFIFKAIGRLFQIKHFRILQCVSLRCYGEF